MDQRNLFLLLPPKRPQCMEQKEFISVHIKPIKSTTCLKVVWCGVGVKADCLKKDLGL